MRGVLSFVGLAVAFCLIRCRGQRGLLRFYGPLEPWFEKTQRPGEIDLVKWTSGPEPSSDGP